MSDRVKMPLPDRLRRSAMRMGEACVVSSAVLSTFVALCFGRGLLLMVLVSVFFMLSSGWLVVQEGQLLYLQFWSDFEVGLGLLGFAGGVPL